MPNVAKAIPSQSLSRRLGRDASFGERVKYRKLGGWRAGAMSLNIKNKEAHKLANQLAKLTGENMTEAVTNAVRERLDRVRCQRGSGLADRLIRIGKDCAARLKEPFRSKDHGDLLYDEKGLPK